MKWRLFSLPGMAVAIVLAAGCSNDPGTTPADVALADDLAGRSDLEGDVATGDVAGTDGMVSDGQDILEAAGRDGLLGWRIFQPEYLEPSTVDGMSFEWDYFMIHNNDGAFTGSIGYLIANPRKVDDLFGKSVPQGANVAVAGSWQGIQPLAEYRNFGYEWEGVDGEDRSLFAFEAGKGDTGEFARMTPNFEDGTLRLEGRTAGFEWDLTVAQDWKELSESDELFVPVTGTDVGVLAPDSEAWHVNMLWPYTKVTGTLTRRDTGVTTAIDGHGYRENSWGRWAFNLGGWDFAVVGDRQSKVMWAWQTYHFQSAALDYLDLVFEDQGKTQMVTFRASEGELGWKHDLWRFDTVARQCVPKDATVVARNDTYRVEAKVDVGESEVPMLSDATDATKEYVIFILFPQVSGTITRLDTGAVVATFSGQGGGEFSVARSKETEKSDEDCAAWGTQFASPLPE